MSIYDVVIVGSGIAGLFMALNLRSDLNVLIITKSKIKASNSYLAQGGVSVLRDDEDFDSFVYDTISAGQFKGNKDSVECMALNSREVINDLISMGVVFDSNEKGLDYTKEGAHSKNRVLHYKDITGREIIDKLVLRVQERENIRVVEGVRIVNILKDSNKCYGVTGKCGDELFNIRAKYTVLATGGVGGMFDNTTNFKHISGDGVKIAINSNIDCENLSYIQIHPTSLYLGGRGRRFLISETLRGEGAYLLNKFGERFIDELLPRDVVSEAIFKEMREQNSKYVYLSFNHKGIDFVRDRFPSIYKKCKRVGYELGRDMIPVSPAVHYFMGGIKIDSFGRTSLYNLYAIGETSSLNIHGKNRLASNALLEGLVFSKRAASDINKNYIKDISEKKEFKCIRNVDSEEFLKRIKLEDEKFYKRWF